MVPTARRVLDGPNSDRALIIRPYSLKVPAPILAIITYPPRLPAQVDTRGSTTHALTSARCFVQGGPHDGRNRNWRPTCAAWRRFAFTKPFHGRKFHLEKTSRLERSQQLSSVPVIAA
jgi:hypothetical protein